MNAIRITLLVLAGTASAAAVAAGCGESDCDEIKAEIREIEARMRAGYTRAQGEKFEAKLRRLKRERKTACR